MYIGTFRKRREKESRLGVLLGEDPGARKRTALPGEGAGEYLLDVGRFARSVGEKVPVSLKGVLAEKKLPLLKRMVREFRKAFRENPKRLSRFLAKSSEVDFLPPIPDPPKIILVGKNYRAHCKEGSAEVPESPVIFSKFRTSLVGARGKIVLPRASRKVDFEAELAAVVGRGGRHIPEKDALRHIAGYMPLNDVSARDFQFSDGQWVRAKSCDTFCPCGPALATSDEVGDPQKLAIGLTLNGQVMQDASTSQMIFPVARLVSFISEVITLEPGDIIATGTPSGVGCFRDPPVFLAPGDTVEIRIEKVGVLRNRVAAEKGWKPARAPRRQRRVFS